MTIPHFCWKSQDFPIKNPPMNISARTGGANFCCSRGVCFCIATSHLPLLQGFWFVSNVALFFSLFAMKILFLANEPVAFWPWPCYSFGLFRSTAVSAKLRWILKSPIFTVLIEIPTIEINRYRKKRSIWPKNEEKTPLWNQNCS